MSNNAGLEVATKSQKVPGSPSVLDSSDDISPFPWATRMHRIKSGSGVPERRVLVVVDLPRPSSSTLKADLMTSVVVLTTACPGSRSSSQKTDKSCRILHVTQEARTQHVRSHARKRHRYPRGSTYIQGWQQKHHFNQGPVILIMSTAAIVLLRTVLFSDELKEAAVRSILAHVCGTRQAFGLAMPFAIHQLKGIHPLHEGSSLS